MPSSSIGSAAACGLRQRPGRPAGGPSVGRLPFRKAAEMDAYVERLVRYETEPPADRSRRTLRFVTGEGLVIDSRLQDGDETVDVAFESVGFKRLLGSLAKLDILKS